jgi:hypothetical protein
MQVNGIPDRLFNAMDGGMGVIGSEFRQLSLEEGQFIAGGYRRQLAVVTRRWPWRRCAPRWL